MSDEASRAPRSSGRTRQHRPSSSGASSVPKPPWFPVESRGILVRAQ
jgi:hypothetical protein